MLKLSSETKCLEKKKNSIDEWTTDCKIQAEIPLKKKKTDFINSTTKILSNRTRLKEINLWLILGIQEVTILQKQLLKDLKTPHDRKLQLEWMCLERDRTKA